MVLEIPLIGKYIQNAINTQVTADSVDWLSYYATTYLFWFFALLTSAKQYFGSPIQCFPPAEFKKAWETYAETYCFINNLYYLPMDQYNYPSRSERTDSVAYYRWVPLILVAQGFSFYFINFIWKFLRRNASLRHDEIIEDAVQVQSTKGIERTEKLAILSKDMYDNFVEISSCSSLWKNGYSTAIYYIFFKLMNLVNCGFNLVLLESFLGMKLLDHGYDMFTNFFYKINTPDHSHFPRVIMCDFEIRIFANVNNYTVQCVIMMNMINEKIFLFFYFWLLFVGAVTFISFFYYCLVLFIAKLRFWYMQSISFRKDHCPFTQKQLDEFVQNFLKADGILIFKFIRQHAGGRIAADLRYSVFYRFLTEKYKLGAASKLAKYQNEMTPLTIEVYPRGRVAYAEETPQRSMFETFPKYHSEAA